MESRGPGKGKRRLASFTVKSSLVTTLSEIDASHYSATTNLVVILTILTLCLEDFDVRSYRKDEGLLHKNARGGGGGEGGMELISSGPHATCSAAARLCSQNKKRGALA